MNAAKISKLITPEVALGLAVIVVGIYMVKRTADGAGKVVDAVGNAAGAAVNAVNPASQTNVIQRAGTAIVRATDPVAERQGLTLSTRIVDWFNWGGINDYDPNAPQRVGSLQLRR